MRECDLGGEREGADGEGGESDGRGRGAWVHAVEVVEAKGGGPTSTKSGTRAERSHGRVPHVGHRIEAPYLEVDLRVVKSNEDRMPRPEIR